MGTMASSEFEVLGPPMTPGGKQGVSEEDAFFRSGLAYFGGCSGSEELKAQYKLAASLMTPAGRGQVEANLDWFTHQGGAIKFQDLTSSSSDPTFILPGDTVAVVANRSRAFGLGVHTAVKAMQAFLDRMSTERKYTASEPLTVFRLVYILGDEPDRDDFRSAYTEVFDRPLPEQVLSENTAIFNMRYIRPTMTNTNGRMIYVCNPNSVGLLLARLRSVSGTLDLKYVRVVCVSLPRTLANNPAGRIKEYFTGLFKCIVPVLMSKATRTNVATLLRAVQTPLEPVPHEVLDPYAIKLYSACPGETKLGVYHPKFDKLLELQHMGLHTRLALDTGALGAARGGNDPFGNVANGYANRAACEDLMTKGSPKDLDTLVDRFVELGGKVFFFGNRETCLELRHLDMVWPVSDDGLMAAQTAGLVLQHISHLAKEREESIIVLKPHGTSHGFNPRVSGPYSLKDDPVRDQFYDVFVRDYEDRMGSDLASSHRALLSSEDEHHVMWRTTLDRAAIHTAMASRLFTGEATRGIRRTRLIVVCMGHCVAQMLNSFLEEDSGDGCFSGVHLISFPISTSAVTSDPRKAFLKIHRRLALAPERRKSFLSVGTERVSRFARETLTAGKRSVSAGVSRVKDGMCSVGSMLVPCVRKRTRAVVALPPQTVAVIRVLEDLKTVLRKDSINGRQILQNLIRNVSKGTMSNKALSSAEELLYTNEADRNRLQGLFENAILKVRKKGESFLTVFVCTHLRTILDSAIVGERAAKEAPVTVVALDATSSSEPDSDGSQGHAKRHGIGSSGSASSRPPEGDALKTGAAAGPSKPPTIAVRKRVRERHAGAST